MKLFELFHHTKKVAESDEIKNQAKLKPSYFTRERKMSFSSLVYYILQPGRESTQLGLNRFLECWGVKTSMTERVFSKARGILAICHFKHWPIETKYDILKNKLKFLISIDKLTRTIYTILSITN